MYTATPLPHGFKMSMAVQPRVNIIAQNRGGLKERKTAIPAPVGPAELRDTAKGGSAKRCAVGDVPFHWSAELPHTAKGESTKRCAVGGVPFHWSAELSDTANGQIS